MIMKFERKQRVSKSAGDYGGPGVVIEASLDPNGKPMYAVAFTIANGFGFFVHFLRENQLTSREDDVICRIDEILKDFT